MRMETCGKEEWKPDNMLCPLVKKTVHLPSNATNDRSSRGGTAAIPSAVNTSDACEVDAVFKLLSSRDAKVRTMALQALSDVMSQRLRWPADQEDTETYLTYDTEGEFRATSSQATTIWSVGRKASRRQGVQWELHPNDARITTIGTSLAPKHRLKVMRTLCRDATPPSTASLIKGK